MVTSIFPKLPEELISAVASQISASGDLFNLCLVSRQFNRITTANLYHRITLKVGGDPRNYERLHSLVISLFKHPEHGALVRHLRIRGQWSDPHGGRDENEAKRIDDLNPALRVCIRSLLDPNTPWRTTLEAGGWGTVEALINLLLYLVPTLRSLDTSIPEWPSGTNRLWPKINFEYKQCLANLQEVAVVESASRGANNYSRWAFFALLQVKSLFFYNSNETRHNNEVIQSDLSNEEYIFSVLWPSNRAEGDNRATLKNTVQHFEQLDTSGDGNSINDIIQNFAVSASLCSLEYTNSGARQALRTFAYDFRQDLIPEHPCFYNGILSTLSVHSKTLSALHLGGTYGLFHATAPPLDFSGLYNLKHLRIPLLFFLGFWTSSDAQSLPDDRMRERFPLTLSKLVLLAYENEEHQFVPSLKHYLEAQPPIMVNLRDLDVHCHAPEAMHAWLHGPAQRRHICLQVYRKLKVKADRAFITPFVNTVEGFQQVITEVEVEPRPSMPAFTFEDLMPPEKYEPQIEISVETSASIG